MDIDNSIKKLQELKNIADDYNKTAYGLIDNLFKSIETNDTETFKKIIDIYPYWRLQGMAKITETGKYYDIQLGDKTTMNFEEEVIKYIIEEIKSNKRCGMFRILEENDAITDILYLTESDYEKE